MKKVSLLFLPFFFSCSFFPSSSQNKDTWFPDEVYQSTESLTEYVIQINFHDQDSMRNEYFIILDFLDKSITAYYDNFERLYSGSTNILRPVLIDGNLSFNEIKVFMVNGWDNELQKFLSVPSSLSLQDDALLLLASVYLYNILIDFWHNKTGELLQEHLNYDIAVNNVIGLINRYQNRYEKNIPVE